MAKAATPITVEASYTTARGTTIYIVAGGVSDFYRQAFVERTYRAATLARVKLNGARLMVEARTPDTTDRDFYGPALKPVGVG